MKTATVRLDKKTDVYAVFYGGRKFLDDKVRAAIGNALRARVKVLDMAGKFLMEIDWFDPLYAAQPTNPNRERGLSPEVQHYDGLEMELDRSEWTQTVETEPKMKMGWDFGNGDHTIHWQTTRIFARAGLPIMRADHRVVRTDVPA